MPSIDTLVDDIQKLVVDGKEISEDAANEFGRRMGNLIRARLSTESPKPTLRLSNLGTPCDRKLYYSVNSPEKGEPLDASAKLKFLFGDILEELLLFLAEEAGHVVEGRQDELSVNGVVGHRDAVIDGRLVDVKSASTYSFKKFKDNGLTSDDPFGYLTQLGSYLSASADDPLVKDKDVASFLVIDKTLGHICLDSYSFERTDLDALVDQKREMLDRPVPPPRGYSDVPEGKSGNRKLDTSCSYCQFKETCWPGLRTYVYAKGPMFLTKVVREPKVQENF